MTRYSLLAPTLLAGAFLLTSGVSHAQTFKVDRYSIGGDGGSDALTAEPGTTRVFIPRGTHVMVVDGATGKVIGDIPDTPRVHAVALVAKYNHGFTTNAGDSTVTMFDLKTLVPIKKIKVASGGLDGIMYDAPSDRLILTNHSRPIGTATAIDPNAGNVVGSVDLEDNGPEFAVGDGKGNIFINNEGKNTVQEIDGRTMKVLASWSIAPCEGPTGIAYDPSSNRIFSGCGKTSTVLNPATGKVVATITNGDGVDGLAFDPSQKLIYISAGRDSSVTVVREDSPDKYTVVATVPTMPGARTIAVDPVRHVVYLINPVYGPAPALPPGSPPPAPGARPRRGPVTGAWFFAISH